MLNKINEIKSYLNTKFKERESIIDALFISVVARQHMLLIGPPGTAKSALVMEFSKQFSSLKYFQWLLTRFSTPEELFGPVSLQELEKGIYKRNVTDKLPEAQLTFLDEIFKSNSAILNALLTIINERLFYNNGIPIKTPLISVIGGSNEYPDENEGLEALFDRFLLRFELDYIGEDSDFFTMLKSDTQYIEPPTPITLDELSNLQMLADMVDIPDEILNTLIKIRSELKTEGIRPSDRRFRQALSLLKAKAALDSRSVVKISDLEILRNSLWEIPNQKVKVMDIVDTYSADKFAKELENILKISKEIYAAVQNDPSSENGMEAMAKFKSLMANIKQLESQYSERKSEIAKVKEAVIKAQSNISNVLIGV